MRETACRIAIATLALVLAACAATFNEPINLPVASNAAIVPPGTPPNVGGDTIVAIAFSGGGTRAAAFAYGAMRGLDRLPARGRGTYFDRVIFISGVSGGSVTAAYFGLKGRAALADFRERFLLRNAEEELNTKVNLVNLARGFGGGVNDSSRFAGWLDQNLYEGATLADLYQPGKPIVWLNASDLYNRTPFLFSPVTFEALCSDPRKYPISQAVAASAAVPVAFVPIVLASFSDACSVPLPPWVNRVLADRSAGAQVRAFAQALQRYRDPEQIRFVKLADGGITDNFGLSGVVIAREAAGQPYSPLARDRAVQLRHLVFIVVNSGLAPQGEWAQTVQGPTGKEMISALTDTAINSAVRSGFDAFRLTVKGWEDATRKWRCGLSRAEAVKLGATGDWRCSNISFDVVEIGFSQLDPARNALLERVPTSFNLPEQQVDLVIQAGTDTLLAHPTVRAVLGKAN
ncbi:MAG TPA: patatin-like phospholipase family protein [Pseudolabrys sp.]|nr:patatin-like phospholipase family protein [Pseudolabrys sp.]